VGDRAEIVFLNGDRKGEVLPLEPGRTVLGRQVGDVLLPDSEVSSIHAIISYERGGWYVMDLGSTNGVYVEDRMRLEARLRDGEEMRLGKTRLRFQLLSGGGATTAEGGAFLGAPDADTGPIDMPDLGLETLDTRSSTEQIIDDLGPDHPVHRVNTQKFTKDELLGAISRNDAVQVTLEIIEGVDRGAVRHFKQESVLIGRLNTDLVLRDSDVSRRHAIIEVFDASQVYLRDLNSTNGCRVNGSKVVSARLQTGDELRIGRCVLRFSARPLYSEDDD
jgi:pSer/pThr/pTyr-binding forkhead associated (FHA) protein